MKNLLSYDPVTGVVTWLVSQGKAKKGLTAGYLDSDGYIRIGVGGKNYYAHHIAWFLTYGVWPVQLDHKDTVKNNNCLANLREAEHSENQQNKKKQKNNSSGFKGVYWHKPRQKWRATIRVKGKRIDLGRYDDPSVAHAVYCAAAAKYHQQFARTV